MGSAHWSRGRTPGFQPCRGDQSLITMATAEDQQKKSEMNDQLREYISQWRDERAKEEAELKRLKDKQAARKEIRAEQEKKQAAQKKGLDPESFTQKHPPTIHMFSKYERRTDTRTYGDRKKLYEGGAEVIRAEWLESMWKEKFAEFSKRPAKKLPKWFGVRPGKKAGDPETPEGEEEAAAEEAAEEEYEEEEEDYEEEEEEEE